MKQKFDIRERFFRTIKRNYEQGFLTSFILLAVVLVILTGSPLEVSATGDHLDTSFNGNGKVTTDFDGLHDYGNDVAIQADGKIVVVGSASTDQGLIARYNQNGTLDTTFNGTGKRIIPSNRINDVFVVAIQADGKIIVGGNVMNSERMVLARYNVNGSIDTTFSGDGFITIFFELSSTLSDLAIQPDGKIVAVGYSRRNDNSVDWVTARINADGTLDTSFGDGGKVFTDFSQSSYARAVSVLPSGRILIAGSGGADFALAQYTANGSPVISFGTGGKVTTDFYSAPDRINDIKVQPDGKIVAAGYAFQSVGYNFALARYNSNGTLDTSFDEDGKVVTNLNPNDDDKANGLVLQSDGKIIAVGTNDNYNNTDFSLVRYNPNGSLDTSFGQSGILFTDINGSIDTANAVAIQPDGRIVVAGNSRAQTTGSTEDFAVVRYLPNSATTLFDFDGDSKTDISIFRPSNGEWWLNRSSDNQTFATQFGQSSDIIVPADYTGDGKTDIALFRPSGGNWFVLRSEDSSFYAFPFGTNGDIAAPADFDGDGRADAAVFRQSNTTWFILRSTGGVTIQQFGATTDLPVPADYDGDSRADIAIFRPNGSSGGAEWWSLRTSTGVFATQFGTATDKAVAADYTGDGKADIAFWRPTTGEWFILRSENFSFYAFPFGTNGDIPAPGDYDGDGRADAAVFRPAGAVWFIQGSTSGVQSRSFGLPTDRSLPNAFVK